MATNAEYLQRGEALDYTNGTDNPIPNGAVIVVGERIGVTGCPIPPGQTGSLHMVGVFEIKKTGTAAVEMGKTVYFDGNGITDTAGSNTKAGYAAAPAAAGDATILVQING